MCDAGNGPNMLFMDCKAHTQVMEWKTHSRHKEVMLRDTVDGEFTTTQDVAEAALFFASFESNALTGQSLIVSHGWSMQ